MFSPQQPPSQEQIESLTKLAGLLRGMQTQTYMPITKSLEAIGIELRTETISINGELIECLVIPLDELMRKEWQRMTSSNQPGEGQHAL
jgi:hypothetical protein